MFYIKITLVLILSMMINIGNNYQLKSEIGEGSFGKIYKGIRKSTQEEVAIKVEKNTKKIMLLHEAQIYNYLLNLKGIPKMRSYGTEGKYTYMVMDLLSYSLEQALVYCKGTFSLKTVLMLAFQMIDRIESLHKRDIIHRDIKPQNFMLGKKESDGLIYIIDFGLSKQYKKTNGEHIEEKLDKKMVGTSRYASLNIHKGKESSRRDDLESLGYIFILFLKGKLPWQNVIADSQKDKMEKVISLKEYGFIEDLHDTVPSEFIQYINYCRHLKFSETPDYKFLKKLFLELFKKKEYILDFQYDWIEYIDHPIIKEEKHKQ